MPDFEVLGEVKVGGEQNLKKVSSDLRTIKSEAASTHGGLGKLGSGFGSLAAKVGGAFAAFEGAKKVGEFLKGATEEAQKFENSFAGLQQVMQNTGQGSKAMTDGMREYIDQTRIATGATADDLMPALARLQAATKNSKRTQDDMNVALDVAAGRHMSVTAVATAMAKAEAGNETAMKRLGVAVKDANGKAIPFTEQMKQLKATYGGTAAAIANVDPWKKVGAMWDIMKEKVGAQLLPVFQKVANWIVAHFPQIEKVFSTVFGVIGKVIGVVMPILEKLFSFLGTVFSGFKTGGLTGGLTKIGDAVTQFAPVIWKKLMELAKKFIAWIGPMIPPMLKELGHLLAKLDNWLYTVALPAVVKQLVKWMHAFAAWIGPALPGILRELGKVLFKILEWIVVKALPAILINLGKLAWGIISSLGEMLAPLITVMAQPFIKAGQAVKDAFWDVIHWFGRLPGRILGAIGDMLSLLLQKGRDVINGLWNGVKEIWATASAWVSGIPGLIKGFFSGALDWLYNVGKDVIQGLYNGAKWVYDHTLKPLVDTITGVLSHLGFHFSEGPLYPVGQKLMKGLNRGLLSGLDDVLRTANLTGSSINVAMAGAGAGGASNWSTTNNAQRYVTNNLSIRNTFTQPARSAVDLAMARALNLRGA